MTHSRLDNARAPKRSALAAEPKSTNTSRRVQRRAVVQPLLGEGSAAAASPLLVSSPSVERAASVHQAAAQGVAGGGSPLPHYETIQQSFGKYDVSNVQATVGGAAAEACDLMGAEAYATDQKTAFRAAPDLHTASHEAAHTVQQRSTVQLTHGVGQVGDVYERHADAVADAVVAGRSAETLLDRMAAPAPSEKGGGGDTVQHKLRLYGDGKDSFAERLNAVAPEGFEVALVKEGEREPMVTVNISRADPQHMPDQLRRFEQILRQIVDAPEEVRVRVDNGGRAVVLASFKDHTIDMEDISQFGLTADDARSDEPSSGLAVLAHELFEQYEGVLRDLRDPLPEGLSAHERERKTNERYLDAHARAITEAEDVVSGWRRGDTAGDRTHAETTYERDGERRVVAYDSNVGHKRVENVTRRRIDDDGEHPADAPSGAGAQSEDKKEK